MISVVNSLRLPSKQCCVPFWGSETYLCPQPWEGCQVMETFPPSQLPSWGTDSNPKIFCLFFNIYLLPYLILRRLACLFGSLRPSVSIQNVLWRSCSTCRWIFDVFLGRKVIFPHYSFAILKILTSFLFPLFCSSAVISTILSSSSFIHSSASVILLLIPSSIFFILVIVWFITVEGLMQPQ